MTDDIVYKTVPLNIASSPAHMRGTPQERAARVQAHMDRVHPAMEAIEREETRVFREKGDPVQRAKDRKVQLRYLARKRAAKIVATKRDCRA